MAEHIKLYSEKPENHFEVNSKESLELEREVYDLLEDYSSKVGVVLNGKINKMTPNKAEFIKRVLLSSEQAGGEKFCKNVMELLNDRSGIPLMLRLKLIKALREFFLENEI